MSVALIIEVTSVLLTLLLIPCFCRLQRYTQDQTMAVSSVMLLLLLLPLFPTSLRLARADDGFTHGRATFYDGGEK
jgi:hypothetical protein